MILIYVMAVLGLLLIWGLAFITVTRNDLTSFSNVVKATQADLAVKSAINLAAEAMRWKLFDPSGPYLLEFA